MEKRVKLFTHTDLDGIGCAVLARHAFGDDVEVSYCNYDDIDTAITEFIESNAYKNFDRVYITDIYVKEETAELIDKVIRDKVKLLDHHSTADLNKYQWARVVEHLDGRKTCGTELLYRSINQLGLSFPDGTDEFVEAVRRRDTWDWKVLGDMRAKELNDLLYIIGRERFVKRFTENISVEFTDAETFLLQVEQERNQQYIEQKKKEVIKRKFGTYTIGIVFAEKLISEIGEAVAQDSDIDFAAVVILPKAVSFRRGGKEINLAEVAKLLGGGGHPAAAGATIPESTVINFLEELLKPCK